MAKKRYKVRKEQLERVVESFVTESAAPEAKKHVKGSESGKMVDKRTNTKTSPEKDWGLDDEPSHAPEAKKHVKGSESGKMVDKRTNTKKPGKMKQAPEAKKHVKGSVSESKDRKIVKMISEKYNISESDVIREREMILEYDRDAFMEKFKIRKNAFMKLTRKKLSPEEEKELLDMAEKDNYNGEVYITKKGPEGELKYKPSSEVDSKAKKLPWWKRIGGRKQTTGA